MGQKPTWSADRPEHRSTSCAQGDHLWVAFFARSGQLAYWQCAGCGLADRETEAVPGRLDEINGWVMSPPMLTVRGPHPPASTLRWATGRGTVLLEGDPSSILFAGVPIQGLAEAHTYVEQDEKGEVQAVYAPSRERHSPYGDHYTLTRFQVVERELVRFDSYCYEESTYDVPNAKMPRQKVVLSGLEPLWP